MHCAHFNINSLKKIFEKFHVDTWENDLLFISETKLKASYWNSHIRGLAAYIESDISLHLHKYFESKPFEIIASCTRDKDIGEFTLR